MAKKKISLGSFIMDLFCGIGTIAQLIAKDHENTNVIGVDIVKV